MKLVFFIIQQYENYLSLVVLTSRPIQIEIENVLRVETNFWKPSRISITSRSTFFFSRSRFFGRDLSSLRYLSRSSRQIETFEIYQDLSRIFEISRHNRDFFKTFSRLQAQKSQQIEKSWSRTVITLTISRSRSRKTVEICQKCHVLTDFSVSIKTFRTCRDKIEISRSRSRYLDSRDLVFETVEIFSTVETDFFSVSRSRSRRDKSRLPTLQKCHVTIFIGNCTM